jgi:hypothetical protein
MRIAQDARVVAYGLNAVTARKRTLGPIGEHALRFSH